jgi:hypothetical protein
MSLDSPEIENTVEEEHELDPNEPYPVVISPFHFVLLCIATMGLYTFWWQYKSWKYFKEKENSSIIPPVWGLLFFIFGIPLFNKIEAYCKMYDHKVMYNSVLVWLACMVINIGGYLLRDSHPIIGLVLGAFLFTPMILPVMEFNFYFTANRNGYKGDKLNNRQIVLLVIGGFLWATVINAILTGNFPPPDPFK